MREFNCAKCGKSLIKLEKGIVVKAGLRAYCIACDPATAKADKVDFGDLFRNFAKK